MTADDLIAGFNVWPNTEARLRDFAEEFQGKNVMVTGACGSIGRPLHEWFVENRIQCVGIDWNEWEVYKNVSVVLGDYATCPIPADTDFVFHCAAYKHLPLGERNYAAFHNNNCKHLIEWWVKEREHLPNKTKIILASSDKAAGASKLGRSKHDAEAQLSGLGGISLRLANVAGSHGSVLDIWETEKDPWCAPQHTERLWMSKRDAIRALLEASFLPPGIYALADVPRYTMGEIATAWENRTARRLRRVEALREGEADHESMVGQYERLEGITPLFSQVKPGYPAGPSEN